MMDAELYVGFEGPSEDGYLDVDDERVYEQPVVDTMSGSADDTYAELEELGAQPVPPLAEDTYAELDERTMATGAHMDDENGAACGVVLSDSVI